MTEDDEEEEEAFEEDPQLKKEEQELSKIATGIGKVCTSSLTHRAHSVWKLGKSLGLPGNSEGLAEVGESPESAAWP